jgi:glycosyltransferase involved in cell wall biosynthesis
MKIAVVTCGDPFIAGGAERHAMDLCEAVRKAGHESDLITLPFQAHPPRVMLDHALAFRLLDLTETCGVPIDRVIALKFPAYVVPHPRKVLWLCHQHRPAYELWDHPLSADMTISPEGPLVRDAIHQWDRQSIPEAQAVYTISRTVSERLRHYSQIESTPLYHPPRDEALFFQETAEDYLFFPSRINRLKRQLLVVQALGRCHERVCVRFAGVPDHPGLAADCRTAARKAKVEGRIEWLGQVSEKQKRELYARCLGVVFPPVDEDYGYVTLEAMLSGKPVITCEDSGGPLEFIRHGVEGYVAEPDADSLARAMDRLWKSRREAAAMGDAARRRYLELNISWEGVLQRLLA